MATTLFFLLRRSVESTLWWSLLVSREANRETGYFIGHKAVAISHVARRER